MSFVEIYEKIEDRELEYLVEFMFQLTIYGREVHSYDSSDLQRPALKQLNEINHRILNRLKNLDSSEPWSDKQYLLNMVSHHVKLAPVIDKGVAVAACRAYEKLNA